MVICQKDLGIIPEDRPSYQSRPTAPRYNIDGNAASRSCLVVPGLGGRKKKKGQRSMLLTSSSGSTTDQSSTGDHIFPSSGDNDRRGLLESANRLTTNTNDWYTNHNEDENVGFFGTSASSDSHFSSSLLSSSPERGVTTTQYAPPSSTPASAGSVGNNSIGSSSRSSKNGNGTRTGTGTGTGTGTSGTTNINQDSSVLLSLPTPTDRSHEARRRGPRKHAYDGEMEPDGVRGQEAEVVPVVSPEQPSIPIRQFYANDPTNTPSSSSLNSTNLNESTTSSQDIRSMIRPDFIDTNSKQSSSGFETTKATSSAAATTTTTFSSPGRQFLKSSPVMLSSTHTPKRDRMTRSRVHSSGDDSDSSETSSRLQIVQNNVAEIVQQGREPSLKSPLPSPQSRGNGSQSESQSQSQYTPPRQPLRRPQPATPPSVQASPNHLLQQQSNRLSTSPGEVSNTTARTATASNNPNNPNPNQPMTFRGKSAPVNVDDTSFEAPEENVTGIHAMAMEHVMRGEYDMALQAFSQVLKVYLDIHGRAHPLTASAYHNLGTVHSKRAGLLLDHTLHQRHCREQALLCFQAAARSARDSTQLGPGHPNVAVSLVRIGFLLLQSRQYQNAVITFHEALRIRVEHYGPTHGLVANLYNNLGVCHMHLQEFPQGRKYLQQALDIQKQLLNEDEFSTTALLELADTLCNIGGLCLEWIRQQGPDARHALDAESAFLEAMEVRSKVLGENHALTNQVRSLHDMVRSIPLPKLSPRSKSSLNSGSSSTGGGGGGSVNSSTASPARQHRLERSPGGGVSSPSMMTSSSPPQRPSPGRPYATSASPPRPMEQQQQQKAAAFSAAHAPTTKPTTPSSPNHRPHTPDELHMPTLVEKTERLSVTQHQQRLIPPSPITTVSERTPSETTNRSELSSVYSGVTNKSIQTIHMDRTAQSELGSSVFTSSDDMECYDASEESCLLAMRDDKASTVVSYSQTTSKLLSGEANSKTSDDRLDCIQQAKSLLNAHKQYMDSPQTSTLIQEAEEVKLAIHPRHHHIHDIANEDGLAPLGGVWPSASTNERITQEILQDPAKHLHTIQKCASNNMKRGQYAKGLHLLEIILECQRQKNGMLHEDVGSALHNVGIAHLRMDNHYSALQSFEESLRIRKGALGRNHPLVAVSLVKVGVSLLLLKRLEDAIWIFREALSVRKSCFGALHPSTARIYNNIGCVHVEFQELKEARRAFEAALDIQRNALVNDPQNGPIIFGAATTLQNLAILYQKRGLQDKAVVVLDEALLLLENVLGESHPTVLETLDRLAEASAAANLGTAALKHNSELLERLYGEADFDKVQESNILYRMSKIHKQNHDVESQIAKLHLALKVLRTAENTERKDTLEKEIQRDMRLVRQYVEKEELDWV